MENSKESNLSGPRNHYFGPFADNRVAAFHINAKRRNFFFTLTDLTGAVIGAVSAGMFVRNRKKRVSEQVTELLIKKLSAIAKAYRIDSVRLYVKFNKKVLGKAAERALRSQGLKVIFIADLVPTAHNGCRKKIQRRL